LSEHLLFLHLDLVPLLLLSVELGFILLLLGVGSLLLGGLFLLEFLVLLLRELNIDMLGLSGVLNVVCVLVGNEAKNIRVPLLGLQEVSLLQLLGFECLFHGAEAHTFTLFRVQQDKSIVCSSLVGNRGTQES